MKFDRSQGRGSVAAASQDPPVQKNVNPSPAKRSYGLLFVRLVPLIWQAPKAGWSLVVLLVSSLGRRK